MQLGTEMGVPDGMTVDSEGNVWGAVWGSGCVIKYDLNRQRTGTHQLSCDPDIVRHFRWYRK